MRSNKTAARTRADAMHDPGGQTKTPGSILPPSIQLKGEKNMPMSLYTKAVHVETDDNDIEDNHNYKTPRGPVVMQDGDMHHPSEPTEPPDDDEGARRGKDKSKVETGAEMVESVKMKQSR
ncbi:hypothetical protein BDN67DRAFT_1016030 [Paxillus ammoniavirescens]|nr:hypothetical protein BDN67DRAFT_1016030 [Paxillus ammoniavirescens]